jgi:hypothetical protein
LKCIVLDASCWHSFLLFDFALAGTQVGEKIRQILVIKHISERRHHLAAIHDLPAIWASFNLLPTPERLGPLLPPFLPIVWQCRHPLSAKTAAPCARWLREDEKPTAELYKFIKNEGWGKG